MRQLLALALPMMAEQALNMLVGLSDTYLANNLDKRIATSATAAIGTIAYILWFVGLLIGTIGTGSTAIIARARGARHRSLANSVCGQSITAAFLAGIALAGVLYLAGKPLVRMTQLQNDAPALALFYLRVLCISLPFQTVMFVANSCLRGAGDAITPATSMLAVAIINIAVAFSLTYGLAGLPAMGFRGIAIGTMIAYMTGGLLQFTMLVRGRGGIRLYWHRLRPHWLTLKRLMRIGIPAGLEGMILWVANFAIVIIINRLDGLNISPSAHLNSIRIEALSYLGGFAVAGAAATLVGQSLGMKSPARATRCAYMAYLLGGGIMTLWGIFFITAGRFPAHWLASQQPQVADLCTRCLFITGWVQCGFAAAIIFAGALRGAGDTLSVMVINLSSIVGIRLVGVLVVGLWLRQGLAAVWVVLCVELMVRGTLIYLWFLHGRWKQVKV